MNEKVTARIDEPQDRFRVVGDSIEWDYKRGTITMTIQALDELFYQYSKHGLNMSQTQVQNKHGLNALEWQSLKRTFDLVKDSDVFSPYSLSLVSGKERCDMIGQKIAEKYNDKNLRAIVEYEDRKQVKKQYDKAIKKVADLDYRFSILETEILDYASKAKAKTVRTCTDTKIDEAIVHVCDLHGGADIKPSRNLPAYGWKQLTDKLNQAVTDINSRKAKNVTIVLNGDFIETFTGLNHANSWKNISEENGYGISATIKVTDILSEFLSKVNNIKEVLLISGNHDRATSSNKEDVEGEVARLISYILAGQFPFKVTWHEQVVSRRVGGCGFIFTHGHLGLGKKTADLIVNQYGYKSSYNMVVMGHLHSRKIMSDTYDSRVVHAPSLFTGNNYSKGLGYSSRSGYLYIYVENKLPVVVDYPLS
jgi:metallophosphoesterase superfamily enzyme